jgi:hypothetical protein
MRYTRSSLLLAITMLMAIGTPARSDVAKAEVKEHALEGANRVKIRVRMEGPYTADVPLQVVCYFKYTPELAKRMGGAPVELDKHLGGVIASLRERGEFGGNPLETILIVPPGGSIEAKALLLVGLGDEDALSLTLMEAVGRVALREAARLGVNKVAFAPLIRDQGNTKIGTGEVERAVLRGMLLAYDTEKRLQKEGLGRAFALEEWWVEAGPAYFDETVRGVTRAAAEATDLIMARGSQPYISGKR